MTPSWMVGPISTASVVCCTRCWPAIRRSWGGIRRRFGRDTPWTRSLRFAPLVPPSPSALDAVLQRALAKQPADRFASISDFVSALDAPPAASALSDRVPSWPRSRFRLGWAILILGVLVGAIALLRPKPPASLNTNLVAIAPFEVLDSSLVLWREGMGDVLSRYLDGAGPLTTVSPTTVFKHWAGRPDRTSAEALGQRTGAGLVVFGNAFRKVQTLWSSELRSLDSTSEERSMRWRCLGSRAEWVSSPIHWVMKFSKCWVATRPIGAVRQASLGAASLPALKAFLRGEQLYRQGAWDSALVQYDRACELDSAFALANRRMAAILWFDPPTTHTYESADEYAYRAERLNRGLSERDSLLIVGLASMMRIGM